MDNQSYITFLNAVIDDGIKGARADYTKPEDKDRLEGSIEGFEACRNKSPAELLQLLHQTRKETIEAYGDDISHYWRIHSREAEVEWVCNILSAAMANSGLTPIMQPTARGAMQAARILAGGTMIVTKETPF